MDPVTPLVINGKRVPTVLTYEVRNPYTDKIVGHAASASKEDCDVAIESAHEAFKTWRETSLAERRNILNKAVAITGTQEYQEKMRRYMSEETAASEGWIDFNVHVTMGFISACTDSISLLRGEAYDSESIPGATVIARKAPFGVIFSVAPWNAPTALASQAVVSAIAFGNTVVFKPSEYSPRCHYLLLDILEKAGLPSGVVNFLPMSRETTPANVQHIIANPLVKKITFTGSDTVGRILAMEAAKYLKPCILELGGKSPALVLEDADLGAAAKGIASGALLHSAQICMATSRVIVLKSVADELIQKLIDIYQTKKAGDPTTDSTASLSALFTQRSAENVVSMVREAQDAGAKVLIGDLKTEGAVVQPHLVLNAVPGMRLWDREAFGPVLAIAVVDTVEDMIELANASVFTLASSIWTSDIPRAHALARLVPAGYTNINGSTVHAEPRMAPAGTSGASGYGSYDVYNLTYPHIVVTHPIAASYP